MSAKDRVVVPSARRLARLFLQQQEQLDKEGQRLVKGLCQEAKLKRAYRLAQGFKRLVQGTSAVSYADWKQSCLASEVPCFVRFAQLLARDEAAVLGALVLSWSNGQVEGQMTRLKLIKRQMYGRAGFALLRQRVVYRSG